MRSTPSFIPVVTLSLIVAVACSRPVAEETGLSGFATNGPRGQNSELPVPALESPLAEQAAEFDKYLQGKLSEEETQSLKARCQAPNAENIFCHAIQRREVLEKRIRARERTVKKFTPPQITAAEVKVVDGKVTNWKQLRKTPVKSLLKGLVGINQEDLMLLKKLALKESRCPNQVAVSVAATLEDRLPDVSLTKEIAGLYEKAADCLRKSDSDRETYYTRAGLLEYSIKNYKIASLYFQRAIRVPNGFGARALYWLMRSQKELGDGPGAQRSFQQLLTKYPYAFHTLVAATAEQKDPGEKFFKNETKPFLTRSKKLPKLNVLIEQAEVLKRGGYSSSAALMAEWAIAESWKAEPEIRLYLATLGDAQLKIIIASDLMTKRPQAINRQWLELYFPKEFWPLFEKHSGELDPYILLSVARQESTLNEKAVSPANAQGLLQIHPDTSTKLTNDPAVDLLDPEKNVSLGSRYLKELLGRLENQIHLALAAYNAGEEKLASWNQRYPVKDPVLFIDLISYRETRNYVASVLRNYYWYQRLHRSSLAEISLRVIDPPVAKK